MKITGDQKKRSTLSHFAMLWLCVTSLVACSGGDDVVPEKEVVITPIDEFTGINEANGVVYIKDLPGSIGNTHQSGHENVFFNLKDRKIINPYSDKGKLLELPEDRRKSNAWDLAFTEVYNSYITINNGTDKRTPGFGGPGKGKIMVLDTLFDELDRAPSEAEFDAFMEYQVSTGWEDFPPGYKGWYFYSLESHLMAPISGVVIVIKTAEGNYAKIEMGSLYQGSPENPTINTPAPYFNFRYYLQTDGGRNLRTR